MGGESGDIARKENRQNGGEEKRERWRTDGHYINRRPKPRKLFTACTRLRNHCCRQWKHTNGPNFWINFTVPKTRQNTAIMSDFWLRKMRTYFSRIDFDKDGAITRKDFEGMADRFIKSGKLKCEHESDLMQTLCAVSTLLY